MTLTIVADDLTGACDTGCLFAGPAPVPTTIWPGPPADAAVRTVDTETRTLDRAGAVARVRAAVAAAPDVRYFKKVDSTLRGHVGPETEALMRAAGVATALLCPAFPAQGRRVLNRVLLVDGVPVSSTAVARDPDFPRRGAPSVVDLLRPDVGRALAWIPIAQVRESPDDLCARLGRLATMLVVADAETDDDLERLAQASLTVDPPPLLVGSAGLARALAARLGLLAGPVLLPPNRRWLVLAGSRHPATRAQARAAAAAGLTVLASPEAEAPDRASVARDLALAARRALDAGAVDAVAVTGGQTAVALCEALGAERIDLVGAPVPGLALGYLRTDRHPCLPILTKAGGFGAPDLLAVLLGEAAT